MNKNKQGSEVRCPVRGKLKSIFQKLNSVISNLVDKIVKFNYRDLFNKIIKHLINSIVIVKAFLIKHKDKIKKFHGYIIIGIAAVLLVIYLLCALTETNKKIIEINKKLDDSIAQNIQLGDRNEELTEEVDSLKDEISTMNEVIEEQEAIINSHEQTIIEQGETIEKVRKLKMEIKSSVSSNIARPSNWGSFKCGMSYAILNRNSVEWHICGELAQTDYSTGIRYIEEDDIKYYCIAIGKGWGYKVGDKLLVTLSTGKSFYAIMGDTKAISGYVHNDGSVVEFVVCDGKTKSKGGYISPTVTHYVRDYDGIKNLKVTNINEWYTDGKPTWKWVASGDLSCFEQFSGGISNIVKIDTLQL